MIETIFANPGWFYTAEIKETETGIEITAGELRDAEIEGKTYPVDAAYFYLTPDDDFTVEYVLWLDLDREKEIASLSLSKAYLDGKSYCAYEGKNILISFPVSVRVSPDGTREGTIFMCREDAEEKKNET
ncbi:hypothetical protein [Bacillus spizizenii]|uniref:hypothetical protein n=1 Tax=Bacillus spizizenii TaxID=96241 RepID=UPI0005C944A3|nr:hypothetical protein [Bacillus spizizenii]MCY7988549.1 hypothetical protein [Bacillus spizizenii]MCY8052185.1 hypothetical protein [Bacillus spizizenii]MCY8646949.1 hypothetical protein [Bacillus spizizenii]MCY8805779.1 hypothetical protein [Bacillus spizizenii]MCY9192392.1 hypothetical protein [Bacillus spizizenii]